MAANATQSLHSGQSGGPQVQSQTDLHRQLQATLYYRTKPYLKKQQNIS